MCGIWGAINLADEGTAQAAARAMHHRGPDDAGWYVDAGPPGVSLVNCRLSIIDLSQAGHQPMSNEDGSLWLVYNGEMYNFADLRSELIEQGHVFRSKTDTEVVLHAYEEWGLECLDRFRGMFAFGLWDATQKRLFAARDRLGIKPLLYTQQGDAFLFASELKTLLASGLIEPRLSLQALHHYLSFYSIPTPYTILQDVWALPPGHYLIYQAGRLQVEPYWDVPPAEPPKMDEREIVAEVRRLLEESVRLRMIADVPVGAFLSGGIDSAAVVALMTVISGERLRTFSIGFEREGAGIDERSAARVLAEHYDTDHHEVIITGRDLREQLDAIIEAMDQPTGDGINTYFVSQATARHVKVALSGLGGDELFGGYPQFRLFKAVGGYVRAWERLPEVVRAAARGGVNLVGGLPGLGVGKRALHWLDGGFLGRYERVRVLFDEEAKLALYSPQTLRAMAAPQPSLDYLSRFVHPAERDAIACITRLELKNYMTHTLLRDTDVMSMAHSLEVRVPLIDHKLVEFAARIPPDLKLRGDQTKWVFAEAVRDLIPAEVIERPKRGFEMPVAHWLRAELRPVLSDVFSHQSVSRRGLFDPNTVGELYQRFLRGEEPVYMRVWCLAALELWMRRFVD
jgi:asparagine synthase (glutamine-hydrolysing)